MPWGLTFSLGPEVWEGYKERYIESKLTFKGIVKYRRIAKHACELLNDCPRRLRRKRISEFNQSIEAFFKGVPIQLRSDLYIILVHTTMLIAP